MNLLVLFFLEDECGLVRASSLLLFFELDNIFSLHILHDKIVIVVGLQNFAGDLLLPEWKGGVPFGVYEFGEEIIFVSFKFVCIVYLILIFSAPPSD
jgi:hypothetical protein